MEFSLQDFGICVTAVISIISLFISISSFWHSKPKLKIEITDKKWDCYFGTVIHDENTSDTLQIGGAKINIINNSPVAITISRICLAVGKERFQYIDNQIPFWETVEISFKDNTGEWTTDGSAIYYSKTGISLPVKINAYDAMTVDVLFHNFPIKIKKKTRGKIELYTAIGRVSKKITLIEYDKNYLEEGYRDYLQYQRSLGDK